MPYALIRHRVRSLRAWLPHFAAHHAVRARYGCESATVHPLADDPDDVVVYMKWRDEKGFHDFVQASDLREVMAAAGVVGSPEIALLAEPVAWERR